MIMILGLLPVLVLAAVLILYRHNGKREILRFDVVQFVNAFVLMPLMFIWLKSFIFFLLRRELSLGLSVGELFTIDTAFSTVFIFLSSFVVIHSLTASFKLKKVKDPLYDIFYHSEYFHLWLSHLVIYAGILLLAVLVSIANLFIPLEVTAAKWVFYSWLVVGLVGGVFGSVGIALGDPKQANFMKIMQLIVATCFVVLAIAYFIFDPKFSAQYGFYWVCMMALSSLAMGSLFIEKSERASGWVDWFKYKNGYDFRVKLFEK